MLVRVVCVRVLVRVRVYCLCNNIAVGLYQCCRYYNALTLPLIHCNPFLFQVFS